MCDPSSCFFACLFFGFAQEAAGYRRQWAIYLWNRDVVKPLLIIPVCLGQDLIVEKSSRLPVRFSYSTDRWSPWKFRGKREEHYSNERM